MTHKYNLNCVWSAELGKIVWNFHMIFKKYVATLKYGKLSISVINWFLKNATDRA
jgi:hypothetical protein